MSLDLRPLRHFEAVDRRGSFRRAAEEQGVSQSVVTRSVRALEEELGLRLFDRTTRSVRLTPAGQHLVERARALLQGAEALEREAALLRGAGTGAVALGASPLPLASLIAPALRGFVASHPGVQVQVETGSQEALVERLLERTLDFVVVGGLRLDPLPWEDEVLLQRLPGEPAVVVARADHPLLVRDADWPAYLDHPWAVPRLSAEEYEALPDPYRAEMARRGFPRLRLESVSACLQLARESDVVTGVPASVGRRVEAEGGLALRAYPFPLETTQAVLSLRDRTPSPAARALRDAIRSRARRAAAEGRAVQERLRPEGYGAGAAG